MKRKTFIIVNIITLPCFLILACVFIYAIINNNTIATLNEINQVANNYFGILTVAITKGLGTAGFLFGNLMLLISELYDD